jgi:PTH2 family peptidyl-tRNA hydrolase
MPHIFKYKQSIVVRKDIPMSSGKMSVQVAHASVGTILSARPDLDKVTDWFLEGFRKIVLEAKSEKEILDLEQKCIQNNIPYFVVKDFGLTELEPNTVTCIGIGPDLNENVDKITGRLKLWK